MGQYHYVVNLTKKQFLHAHKFNEGIKLMEFGCNSKGLMTALAVLLSNSTGRGGGDFHGDHPLVGSWAGDSIVIAGDYAELGDSGEGPIGKKPGPYKNIYTRCDEGEFEDISADAIEMLKQDEYVATALKGRVL